MTISFTVRSVSIAGNVGDQMPPSDVPSVSVFLQAGAESMTLMVTQSRAASFVVGQSVTLTAQ